MAGDWKGARVVLVDRADDTFHSDGALRQRALERHGCHVTAVEIEGGGIFDRIRRLSLPERVERAVKSASPDLVLVARREALDAGDLVGLRQLGQARWAVWTTDDLPDLAPLRAVARSYDRIFVTGTDVVQALEEEHPGKPKYLPLACDPSFHRPMRARGPYRANVVFAGRATEGREMLLGGLVEYGLALWGPGWRKTLLRDYCRGELPKSEDYVRAYAGATVAINIHHRVVPDPAQATRGCNQRLFELAGIGALQMVDFRADLGALFSPGEEVLVYHDGDELREMVRRALYDQPHRESIAEAGRRRGLREHTYMHRMQAILTDLLPGPRTP
jgi:spore maturation protein CgeB